MSTFNLLKARMASLHVAQEERRDFRIPKEVGSTPGGFHKDDDGDAWYVKRHTTQGHAHVEHLANQVYRGLGVGAPHSQVLYDHDRKPVYFSKHVKGYVDANRSPHLFHPDHEQHLAHQFLRGTAADALIGNRDLHGGNYGVVHGRAVVRIDNGSAFGIGAQGQYRERVHPEDFLRHVTRHGASSGHHAMMLAAGMEQKHVLHPSFIGPQVHRILKMRDSHGGWEGFVNRHIPGAPGHEKRDATNFLNEGTRDLVDFVHKGIKGLGK